MKKYRVSYWEQESVWVRRTIEVESEKKPTTKNMEYILVNNPTVDYTQEDYDSVEHLYYDFDTDFEVEEV